MSWEDKVVENHGARSYVRIPWRVFIAGALVGGGVVALFFSLIS
jgi:hypothetical protein